MHPDPTPAPKPQPIIHVSQTPTFVNQPDGTVRAYYPTEDYYVIGTDREDATKKLINESERHMADPEYIKHHFALAREHLRGDSSTPGFEVRTISQQDYRQRTTELAANSTGHRECRRAVGPFGT
jgi:hypothetical protein